jgi:hypothetical protein
MDSPTQRLKAILTTIATCAWCFAGGASGEPNAARPEYKVGDKWVFAAVDGGDAKGSEWSREIIEVVPGGLKARTESGTALLFDEAMNFAENAPENARLLIKYPVQVGATWTFSRRTGQNGQAEERGEAKVVAKETVTVPAGAFECFRIEAKSQTSFQKYSANRVWTRWYCPDIKWIAREVLEMDEFRPGVGGMSRTKQTSELKSVNLAK